MREAAVRFTVPLTDLFIATSPSRPVLRRVIRLRREIAVDSINIFQGWEKFL